MRGRTNKVELMSFKKVETYRILAEKVETYLCGA